MSEPACPRCAGLVANLYDDPHCLNCGWRRRGRKSSMTVEERKERNRQYMREYWRRRKAGITKRSYTRKKVTG